MTIAMQHKFDSLSAYVDAAQDASDIYRLSHREERDADWSGTHNFREAMQLATTGWDGPRAEVQATFERLSPKIRKVLKPRLERRLSTRGRKVLPGRMAQGHPQHTVRRVRTTDAADTRTVTVCVNGVFSAGVDADVIRKQGAALLALCDALTFLGVSTEVWVASNVRNVRGESYGTAVKVKRFEDRTGTDRLMFAMAHPAMLRRLFFGVFEGDSHILSRFPSYGTPMAPSVNGIEFDVVMGANPYGDAEAMRDPVAWVLAQIEGLNLA